MKRWWSLRPPDSFRRWCKGGSDDVVVVFAGWTGELRLWMKEGEGGPARLETEEFPVGFCVIFAVVSGGCIEG